MVDVAVLVVRLLVASILLLAGWIKIREGRQRFFTTVRGYGLLPRLPSAVYASALPWVELTVGIALLFGFLIHLSALAALAMVASFMIAALWAIARRLNLTCSCFGLLYRERIGLSTVVRDIVMAACCIVIVLFDHGEFAMFRLIVDPAEFVEIVASMVTLSILAGCVWGALRATRGIRVSVPR